MRLTADNRKLSTKHRLSCRKNPEKPAIMRKAVQQLVDFKGVTCVFNRRDTRARSLLTIYIGKVGFEHGTHGTFKLRWSRNRSGAPVWSALWTSLGLTCTGLRLHWADSWLVRKQHARSRAAGCKAPTVLQPVAAIEDLQRRRASSGRNPICTFRIHGRLSGQTIFCGANHDFDAIS